MNVATVAAIFVIVAGCDGSGNAASQIDFEPATPELIAHVRGAGWLDTPWSCARMDMTRQDYEACLRVETTLLPPLDPNRRDLFGEQYDPPTYFACRMNAPKAETSCAVHKLRRVTREPIWPSSDAPPMIWPEPPRRAEYRPGMSAEAYFDELCEREAGKFIFRTAVDVHGVYQIRPLEIASEIAQNDRYVIENPYHHTTLRDPFGATLIRSNRYLYWESSIDEPYLNWDPIRKSRWHRSLFAEPGAGARFVKYLKGRDAGLRQITKQYGASITSKYGFIWRGIRRPHDRKYRIAGGELAVVELETSQVLAVWRGFSFANYENENKTWWPNAIGCPDRRELHDDGYFNFLAQVIKPPPD